MAGAAAKGAWMRSAGSGSQLNSSCARETGKPSPLRRQCASMAKRKTSFGSPVPQEITIAFKGGVTTGHFIIAGDTITVTDASGHSTTTRVEQTPTESLAKVLLADLVAKHSK